MPLTNAQKQKAHRQRTKVYQHTVKARAKELKDIVAFYQQTTMHGTIQVHYDLPTADHRTLQDECERRGWDFDTTLHDIFREILLLDKKERKEAARTASKAKRG